MSRLVFDRTAATSNETGQRGKADTPHVVTLAPSASFKVPSSTLVLVQMDNRSPPRTRTLDGS